MSNSTKVLIVDGNVLDVLSAEDALSDVGYNVKKLTSPNGVIAKAEYEMPDFLMLDINMPRLDVGVLMNNLAESRMLVNVVVVLFSDMKSADLRDVCIKHNAHGYFCKAKGIPRIVTFLEEFYED